MSGNEKKRHHYVPKAYLRAFCDASGKLWAFPKDDPLKPFKVSPGGIAHERYYYSQPSPDGGQDNNRLEDFFSKFESEWSPIVARWLNGDPANDKLGIVIQFLANMRTRIPAARDTVEALLSNGVKATARRLEKLGKLPPIPEELTHGWDDVDISIDPHQSIHAMAKLIQGLAPIFDAIGLEAVQNDTDIPLITSDNPVAYFDPEIPETACLPYTVRPTKRPVELLFPVTPKLMLRGHSDFKRRFALHQRRTADRQEIKRFNRIISRFGYRFVFASDRTNDAVILKYAETSPVPDFQNVDAGSNELLVSQMVFGKRKPKPKWTGGRAEN